MYRKDLDNGKYKHIRAWSKLLGSGDYYTVEQIRLAVRDNAPADAIYKQDDGSWFTYKGVTIASSRRRMDALLKEMR